MGLDPIVLKVFLHFLAFYWLSLFLCLFVLYCFSFCTHLGFNTHFAFLSIQWHYYITAPSFGKFDMNYLLLLLILF